MAELEQWWQALDDQERLGLLALKTGDVLPTNLVATVGDAGLAVGAKWEHEPGYTFTVVERLGDFLDSKRGTCMITGCGHDPTQVLSVRRERESGKKRHRQRKAAVDVDELNEPAMPDGDADEPVVQIRGGRDADEHQERESPVHHPLRQG